MGIGLVGFREFYFFVLLFWRVIIISKVGGFFSSFYREFVSGFLGVVYRL